MLKTYRIIPLVFILFLFGFTFITVAPVLSEDSPEFVACQQIKPSGDFRLMKQKKNCFRDVARLYQVASVNSAVTPSDPSGGEVAELNAKISGLEARLGEVAELNAKISGLEGRLGQVAVVNVQISELRAGLTELKGVVRALQEQSQNPIQPVAPSAPSGGEVSQLSAKVEELHEAITKGHLPPNHRHKMLCNYDPKTGYRCGQFTSRMGDGYKGTNYGE